MIDPVMRDLDRHLADIDHDDAIQIHAEHLLEDDPDTYTDMDEHQLREAAASDLEEQAAEAAVERHLDMLNDPYYD